MSSKNISVDVLSRVEGDGGIQVKVKNGKVEDVIVDIFEGPRMIEALVRDKTIHEIISLVSRICAICTVSHRYVSIKTIEKAIGIKVPEKVELLRFLMHLAEYVESHILHVYFLALPDFFRKPSAIALLPTHGETVVEAITMKKYGTELMKLLMGRKIHGENPQIGGFGRTPTDEELDYFAEKAKEFIPVISSFIDVLASLEIPDYCERPTTFMCCNPPDGKFGFEGDTILISTGEEYPVEDYKKMTNERVVPHSYAKRSRYNEKPFTVGALAGVVAGFWTGIIQDPLFVALGIMDWPLPTDIYFTILSAIPSLGYGAIFGAFFGLLAAIFFDNISGKRILKGLIIGLIYCLFSALYPIYSFWVFDNTLWAYIFLLTSPIDKFIYGMIFAYLYKK